MRFKSMFIFATSLLAYSQLAQSADVWQGQPSYPASSQHHYGMAPQMLPRYPRASDSRGRISAFENRSAAYPGNYRFRDWRDGGTNQASRHSQVPVVRSHRTVSYWGGNPVNQGNSPTGMRPRAVYPDQPTRSRQTYQPPRMAYAQPQYRFRPLQKRSPVESQARLKYRPMQVEIPQHVRFRPLNPVAQTRPRHTQENGYRWIWPQPNDYALQQPGYYQPVQSWQQGRYTYNYPYPRGWRANDNAWRAPAPQPIVPSPMAMPGYAWSGPAPRFRPQPLPRQMHYPPAYPRHAHNMGPYWVQNRQAGYPVHPQPVPNLYNRYSSRLPMARPQWQPPLDRNRGTDWYDGRRDGEGAWYQLAKRNLPAVSQRWRDPAGDNLSME